MSAGSSVEDTLYLQARGVHGKDFEEWVTSLHSILQSRDRGPGCLTLLRQLYVLTAATKFSRNLTTDIYRLLLSVILEPEQGSARVRLLACAILCDLSPSRHIVINDFNPPVEIRNISFILPVLLAQTNKEKLSSLAPTIVSWLTKPGTEDNCVFGGLTFLHSLCSHSRTLERISEDKLRAISTQLSVWLQQASRNTMFAPSSGISLFGGGAKKQLIPVKEIDGTVSQEIFTVLSIGEFYSADQLLNIATFSFLRRWLLTTLTSNMISSTAPTPTLESSVTPTSSLDRHNSSWGSIHTSSHPHPYTTSLPSPLSAALAQSIATGGVGGGVSNSLIGTVSGGRMKHGLRDSVFQYCLRVINQCERKPAKCIDDDLVNACLYECISVLDILCSLSRTLINGVFPTIKRLYTSCTQNPLPNARLLLVLVKFFINHVESEMYDSDGPIALFFDQVLSVKFNDLGVAYDTVEFLVDNLEVIHCSTNILTKYFPNIFKILAWSPSTFIAEFLQLLPAFISKATVLEVLHTLLDLPCLSATLQAQHIINTVPAVVDSNLMPQYSKCLAAFQDPMHKFMCGYFLRAESGKGDTINKLKTLLNLLEDFSKHQRIVEVAEITPLLVRLFFKTVLYASGHDTLSQLVTILLERALLLYSVDSFQTEARGIISEQLLEIFRLYPHFVVDFKQEILEFLGNLRNLSSGGETFYLHLVWILGEYSHSGYDSRCTTTLLAQYFETLESVAYEASLNLHKSKKCTTRLVLIIMSTVAKIASRCQDLIPRALLCLNKIVQLGSEATSDVATHKMLLSRANELVNVLKIPSIASAVLSSSPLDTSVGDYETSKQTSIAYLLQSVSRNLRLP